MTCLVTERGTVFIAGGNQTQPTTLPLVTGATPLQSPKTVVDPQLQKLLAEPLPVPKPKKKKNKKKSSAAGAAKEEEEKED